MLTGSSDQKGRDAKINVGADGNIFELVENSKYLRSEPERGKDHRMHRGVNYWDYFVKTVQIDGSVFDLTANVRKKADGQYVYVIEMHENKEIEPSSPEGSQNSGLNGVPNSSIISISNSETEVNQKFSRRKQSDTETQQEQNKRLEEDVAQLKELVKLQGKVTHGKIMKPSSVKAAAKYLKKLFHTYGDTKELAQKLNGLYEYIASDPELTWEGVKEQAAPIVQWLQDNEKFQRDQYAQDVLDTLKGQSFRLDETQLGEVKSQYGSLRDYKTGKGATDRRIIASEQWWKLRNTEEEQKETEVGKDGGFTSRSGWLHNVIVSKHADAMEAFPQPVILPREKMDEQEAKLLSDIIPCILENNKFEKTYSDAMWQKMKTGTGVYKVVWDKNLLNGLGDIRVEDVNLLNLYWQPGITDIQKSRYFFQTEMIEKEVLMQKYPQLEGKLRNTGPFSSRFLYDDAVSTSNYVTVIEVYYHKHQQGKGKTSTVPVAVYNEIMRSRRAREQQDQRMSELRGAAQQP